MKRQKKLTYSETGKELQSSDYQNNLTETAGNVEVRNKKQAAIGLAYRIV